MRIIFLFFALLFATNISAQEVAFAAQREAWLRKAEEAKPKLQESVIKPQSIVRSVADEKAFQGWRMECTDEAVEALYKESFKPR